MPDSVDIETLDNRAIIFTVRTRVLWELERWIMKNSPVIKILEPESVVEDIKWTIKETYNLYGGSMS